MSEKSSNQDSSNNTDTVTKDSISKFFNDESSHIESDVDIVTDRPQNEELSHTEIVSNIYKEILNREPDLGGLKNYSYQLKFKLITEEKLRSILKESDEYKQKFGISNKNLESNWYGSDKKAYNSLVYCMMGTNRLDEIKPYIETVLPHIDKFIFVDGGSEDGTLEYIQEISSKTDKIVLIQKPWKDRFSEQRNNYIQYLRDIQYSGFVLTSDTDEHFPEETLKQLRTIIKESDNGINYNGANFQVEDVIVDDDNRNIVKSRKINEYWKPLLFKFSPEIHYEGEPHETLVGSNLRWTTTNLIYQHIRSSLHIMTRASENFFISNSNRYSDKWAEFRYRCTTNNISTFKDYWSLFEKHELPKDVENWIILHKEDKDDEGDSEVRETYILYEEVLPKRKQKKLDFGKRMEQSLDSKLTNEIVEKIKDSVLLDEITKKQEEPKYNYQTSNYNITSGTSSNTLPDIRYKVETSFDSALRQSEYELINQYCEQCSSPNEALIEMIIHHKHGITMCKKCWLNLADYIRKKVEGT